MGWWVPGLEANGNTDSGHQTGIALRGNGRFKFYWILMSWCILAIYSKRERFSLCVLGIHNRVRNIVEYIVKP